jgi:uncharacterized membrane protein YcaP (DUF421 family)
LALRIFGKKELAQLSVVDLVFILLISNAVQNSMVGPDTSLLGGITAAVALFVINFIFKKWMLHNHTISQWIQGSPEVLIYKGRINHITLQKTGLTEAELMAAVREHGVAHASEVDLAMLEVDGNVSVISNDFKTRTHQHKVKLVQKKAGGASNI